MFGADQQTTDVHELLEIDELPTRNVQVVWHLDNSFTQFEEDHRQEIATPAQSCETIPGLQVNPYLLSQR